MIVDDDDDDIDFFCQAIRKIDPTYTCMSATDGEAALQKLQNETNALPDFIFLDLNMPRMDGKTCLRELKKQEKLKDIPVIIYTTSSHPQEREETLQLGAAHFLTKAYSIKMLQEGIRNVLEILGATNENSNISNI
ncbi:response regulator [Ulvibacterium marinum]|uniref:Response regulator n=2 Tax=Ulvibacterium marinum TaxID=2419782 RepID=A0A3B0CFJ2_9FLAO|nr:response regulator [Ulvibacterium marinum]